MRLLVAAGTLFATALWAVSAVAQTPDPSSPEGAVLAAEARRYKATVDADVKVLEEMLADDLRYTHANGSVEGKYQFIASLESGNLDYQAIATRDVSARVVGDAAVITGIADLRLVVRGAPTKAALLYTAAYVKRDGAWLLWVYQSTRHPTQP